MKYHTYLDKDTYDIVDNVFEVDNDIAETISVLNKKGYITEACCAGHTQKNEFMLQRPDIQFLVEEDLKRDFDEYYISDVTDKDFALLSTAQFAQIYIVFKEPYVFETIPEGFTSSVGNKWDDELKQKTDEMYIEIRKHINYYDKGIKRSNEEVLEEIKKYNELLLKWAKSLPDINERNDKNE